MGTRIQFAEPLHGRPALVTLVFFVLGLALNFSMAVLNSGSWGLDYNQFYAASRLAGTGHVYDWPALRRIELEHGLEMPMARLPVVVYGHKLLGALPYPVARGLWLVIGSLALVVFGGLWPGVPRGSMAVAVAWSMPAAMSLVFGQDITLFLMFFALGLALMERDRSYLAGVAFSLCLCKYHLALGIPVLLLARKSWKTLISAAVSVAVWIACCFIIEGPDWLDQYAKILRMPLFSPAPERMPTVHGVLSWLHLKPIAEAPFLIIVAVLLWFACRGNQRLTVAGSAAMACGLVMGRHAYAADSVLLLPLAVLIICGQTVPGWLKIWGLVLLSPLPVLLLISNHPLYAQLSIAGFAVTALCFIKAPTFYLSGRAESNAQPDKSGAAR